MKICIDAGHGLFTAGKRCMKKLDPNETREWYLNDRIADIAEKHLKALGHTVYRSDDTTGRKDISLSNRVKLANLRKCDVFISIHHNAGINGGKGGGIVVYYNSSNPTRLTQAKRFYDLLIAHTGLVGNRSAKVVNKAYYVIKHTSMPAFLLELGYMDSSTDVPIILSQDYADKSAQAIIDFVNTFQK